MKTALKIGGTIVVLWLVVFLVYQATLIWNPAAIEKKTEAFLNAVQAQSFEEAAALFDGAEGEESLAFEIQKLHEEQGVRLLSYRNVKAEYDDGSFNTGHVDLTFEVDGNPLDVKAILTFGVGARPKQVCVIQPSELKGKSIPQLESWNELVCGGSF
ncbi:hypothetical protein D3C78_1229700 [compost metagenome]